MTVETHQRKNTLRRFTNGDSFQTFDQQWAISTRGISCYLVPGFTPSIARFVHDSTISKDVCLMFVLRCQSTSHLTCLVSSHLVHLLHTIHKVIQLYSRTSCTTIHPYINTFTYSHIHAEQHIHNINLHMVTLVT